MISIWEKTAEQPSFSPLDGNRKTDVLIIGGGIAGLLTAYKLITCHSFVKRKRACLLESNCDNITEEGKLLCVERFTGNGVFQLGAESIDYLFVV